jgi:hypothetical protein
VGTPSLEARNVRLDNIITSIIEESKLISGTVCYYLTILIKDQSSLKLQSRDQNRI